MLSFWKGACKASVKPMGFNKAMFDKFLSNKEIILQMKHFTRFYYQPFYVVLINLQVIYKKAAEIEFTKGFVF